jgi:hypothetical protein
MKPRYGVGLNELLGVTDAEKDEVTALLPKTEVRKTGRALNTIRVARSEQPKLPRMLLHRRVSQA